MTNRTFSDAAKRVVDTYSLHQLALGSDSYGKWFWVNLGDGTSDNELYDSKRDAVRHSRHSEMYNAYVQIIPHTMTLPEAEGFLSAQRKARRAGLTQADPDHKSGGLDLIRRVTKEDQTAQFRALFQKG